MSAPFAHSGCPEAPRILVVLTREMHMRDRNRTTFVSLLVGAVILSLAAGATRPSAAQELGLAVKKPVVAAACKLCPWGTIADVLKEALMPQGYDLQICYTCSR